MRKDEGSPDTEDEQRLQAVQDALEKVQGQAAALEELSEQLALSVHTLEGEIARLAAHTRARAAARSAAQATADSARSGEPHPSAAPPPPARSTDVEGARLVALNMALEGSSRQDADRYLAEHFDVPDRARLLDEVFAAVGGS
jgi:septal ring factor EnvC (AmiA/AmiB activator)